ncbi:HEPN domain-containing protein [Candidatus Entotheonella palauensis]|uniref:HEPN domain-containing protein n=1 Tax=Candidatus Entotheonella palauensis TaxID=93172 RepID=UPI000B7D36FD|nr:HEPN domain-containing protein [Candidatus Entotheonella palauensis]
MSSTYSQNITSLAKNRNIAGIKMIIMEKTPLQKFSKSLVWLKFLPWIQRDLKNLETNKKAFKIMYLNQSYILHVVALWQVFIEDEVKYVHKKVIENQSPGPFNVILQSQLERSIKRFMTPKKDDIDKLFSEVIGFDKISEKWEWDNMPRHQALRILDLIIQIRHQIAHKGRAKIELSFEKNFDYMKHIFNLAYITEYEIKKFLANLSGENFNEPRHIPHLN